MDLPFCEILYWTPEGQVESAEIYYDQMTMLGQLGHLELPRVMTLGCPRRCWQWGRIVACRRRRSGNSRECGGRATPGCAYC